MSLTIASERRMLTEAEFEAVGRTRHPEIRVSPKEELVGVARRVRGCRTRRAASPATGGASGGARRSRAAPTQRRARRAPR